MGKIENVSETKSGSKVEGSALGPRGARVRDKGFQKAKISKKRDEVDSEIGVAVCV